MMVSMNLIAPSSQRRRHCQLRSCNPSSACGRPIGRMQGAAYEGLAPGSDARAVIPLAFASVVRLVRRAGRQHRGAGVDLRQRHRQQAIRLQKVRMRAVAYGCEAAAHVAPVPPEAPERGADVGVGAVEVRVAVEAAHDVLADEARHPPAQANLARLPALNATPD